MTNTINNKTNYNNNNNINKNNEIRKLLNDLNKTSIVGYKENNNNSAQFKTEMNKISTKNIHNQQSRQLPPITTSSSTIRLLTNKTNIRNTEIIIEESFQPIKKLLKENSKDDGIKSQFVLQQNSQQNLRQEQQQQQEIEQKFNKNQMQNEQHGQHEQHEQHEQHQQEKEEKLPENCQKSFFGKRFKMFPKTTTTTTATTKIATKTAKMTTTKDGSSKLSSSSRKPSRKVLPSLDCLLVTAIFSLIFLMVGNLQIVKASPQMGSSLKNEPMFISRSETFKFVAGDTIQLPCEVANSEAYVVAWKRGIAILSAGAVKVTPDPRVRLVKGFNLYIRDAVPQDAGDYICQIATLEPREITHTVEILVPPRIHHISSGGHLQVKKGSSVRIECSASGNPTPNVTWSRKNNILPNGEEKLHSHILSIEHMDRHKGGVYICSANNNVGQPASSQVVLHVLYPPEISVERPIVFSGEGREAMLVCIVHGETQPEVIWFKETMQLDTTERHIMENRGSRHTLIIRKVHQQDFGNYSCVAENQLGKSRKTLQLSGKPNVAVFNSPPISQFKDKYNISWTVDSHSPIEEFKLYYRRLPQGHEIDNIVDQSEQSHHQSSIIQMYNSGGINTNNNHNNHRINGVSGKYGGNLMHWPGRNEWRDVVLPTMPLSHHFTQGMNYIIRDLDPDQQYEAKVEARNRYGWSSMTNNFIFSTSSNDDQIDLSSFHGLSDNEMRDLSVTFYGGSAEKRSLLSSKIIIICLSFIYFTIFFNFE